MTARTPPRRPHYLSPCPLPSGRWPLPPPVFFPPLFHLSAFFPSIPPGFTRSSYSTLKRETRLQEISRPFDPDFRSFPFLVASRDSPERLRDRREGTGADRSECYRQVTIVLFSDSAFSFFFFSLIPRRSF